MEARVVQQKLDGSYQVATGNAIRDQLAAIMEAEPETQADEDLLTARWLQLYRGYSEYHTDELTMIAHDIRVPDLRRRRQELAASGLYPWPEDEAERRQKRAKGGAPR